MLCEHYADTFGLLMELAHAPHLWDQYPMRTEGHSPHREISDIWVRYNPIENLSEDIAQFHAPHLAQWYAAVREIPTAKDLSEKLASDFDASIGGVLITKIPAHKQCYPHIDEGWHARHYEKFALQVKGNKAQSFHVEDEELVTVDGDLFTFDNSKRHWVSNDSDEDRITMIVCLRRH
jgi:hypothetical protein